MENVLRFYQQRGFRTGELFADPEFDPRKFSGIAFEIATFNLVVIWSGYKLDQWLANKIPWMIIVAVLLSVTGTIYYLFKKLNS